MAILAGLPAKHFDKQRPDSPPPPGISSAWPIQHGLNKLDQAAWDCRITAEVLAKHLANRQQAAAQQ